MAPFAYEFLLAFHSNYGPVLYHFPDNARYWLTTSVFSYPLHSTSPLGGLCRNITIRFDMWKNLNGVAAGRWKSLRICLLVLTQYTNVTDRQTPHDSMGRAYA